uniref:Uncharacterized protein n=1 Tax=Solanum tuberosum TaxID=4113 RepID=M0ZI54_SOLTU
MAISGGLQHISLPSINHVLLMSTLHLFLTTTGLKSHTTAAATTGKAKCMENHRIWG